MNMRVKIIQTRAVCTTLW